jgi:hypothetical protein
MVSKIEFLFFCEKEPKNCHCHNKTEGEGERAREREKYRKFEDFFDSRHREYANTNAE